MVTEKSEIMIKKMCLYVDPKNLGTSKYFINCGK